MQHPVAHAPLSLLVLSASTFLTFQNFALGGDEHLLSVSSHFNGPGSQDERVYFSFGSLVQSIRTLHLERAVFSVFWCSVVLLR